MYVCVCMYVYVCIYVVCLYSIQQQCHHRREPKDHYIISNDRSDIIMFESDIRSNVELDIALAHLWRLNVLPSAAKTDGAAARR